MSDDMIRSETEKGQTMAEYTVILGVITIAIVTTFSLLSDAMLGAFVRTIEIVQTAF